MDCRSTSAAERKLETASDGVQWPNERKPIFFMRDKSPISSIGTAGSWLQPYISMSIGTISMQTLTLSRRYRRSWFHRSARFSVAPLAALAENVFQIAIWPGMGIFCDRQCG